MTSNQESKSPVNPGNTCLELALEGERLCKSGDFQGGIAFFEAAISIGTNDLKTLSAIYSQLGNAYFYVGEYSKAMEYHKLDLTVARAIGDRLGEAKASGNLGNSLKMMGKFDEAVICCRRHLEISHELADKVGESRALYNLGNVYHSKGKHIAGIGHQDPGEFPEEVKICLQKAVEYYEENLKLMTELGDRLAQGRAYGNLGNTHYLLGNFDQAITFHQQRLKLAKEFGDKSAERRAYNNLGNAHIFLGEFESAAEFFKKTLSLAEELGDRAVEAQACYSLGNTYTLLRDYATAIQYHLRHLRIAQDLRDKVGESRAYWSLGNAHSAMGNHETALKFANKHLEISKEIGDCSGQVTAQISISDLRKILGFHSLQNTPTTDKAFISTDTSPSRKHRYRRSSMENMDLLKLTPDARNNADNKGENKENVNTENASSSEMCQVESTSSLKGAIPKQPEKASKGADEEDSFFDLLSRFQSERMDDQRCDLDKDENSTEEMKMMGSRSSSNEMASSLSKESLLGAKAASSSETSKSGDDLFDLIAGMQSRRMDEQRASLPRLPGLGSQAQQNHNPGRRMMSRTVSTTNPLPNSASNFLQHQQFPHRMSVDNNAVPDDDFFDMLMRCQATRIEDQRSSMPDLLLQPNHHPVPMANNSATAHNSMAAAAANNLVGNRSGQHGATVPDDDFFTLILRFQGGRIEDQRSSLPSNKSVSGTASLDRGGRIGGSLRNPRTGGSLLKSSLKQGILGTRLSK